MPNRLEMRILFPKSEEKTVQEHIVERRWVWRARWSLSKKQTNLKSDQKENQRELWPWEYGTHRSKDF